MRAFSLCGATDSCANLLRMCSQRAAHRSASNDDRQKKLHNRGLMVSSARSEIAYDGADLYTSRAPLTCSSDERGGQILSAFVCILQVVHWVLADFRLLGWHVYNRKAHSWPLCANATDCRAEHALRGANSLSLEPVYLCLSSRSSPRECPAVKCVDVQL